MTSEIAGSVKNKRLSASVLDTDNPGTPVPQATPGAQPTSFADLPDSPEPKGGLSESASSFGTGGDIPARAPRFTPRPLSPLYDKYIEPGQRAQPLAGPAHKVYFGVHQIASPYFVLAVVSSAGYEQWRNGSPNYGTDSGAFGQRLGAAGVTNAAQSIFTDGLMPAIFHQDPRYYVLGPSHSFIARGGYAISRVFVTRSDAGASTPNYSLFAGHAATAGLQNAYFPDANRGASETLKNFGNSLAGTALSNGIREFFPDLLRFVHLE